MSKRILVIPDLHIPYEHPDAFKFLSAIKKKFNPDRVVCLGDEIDWHSISFHEHSAELYSPGHELEVAIKQLKKLYELFPVVTVLNSNHGSLVLRKAIATGLPQKVIRSPKEFLEAPHSWDWRNSLTLKASNGELIHFLHGKNDAFATAKNLGMNFCQGHIHTKFYIQYWASPRGLHWVVQSPCLIDNETLAFAYNKLDILSPILGATVIIDGHPQLIVMKLDKNKRWSGKL